jgi:hypothetical protein
VARANLLRLLVNKDFAPKFGRSHEAEDFVKKQNLAFVHPRRLGGTISEEPLMLLNPYGLLPHDAVCLGLVKILRNDQLDGRILPHTKPRVFHRTANDCDKPIHIHSGN